MMRILVVVVLVQALFGASLADSCSSGWVEIGDSCYKIFETSMNFNDAEAVCQSEGIGGHLASVSNAEDNQKIVDAFKDWKALEGDLWLGLTNTSEKFEWINGNKATYRNWYVGEPGNNKCSMMLFRSTARIDGRWGDKRCASMLPALCSKDRDDCSSVTCFNGGTCVDRLKSYTCTCPSGFTGTLCQVVDHCKLQSCKNGGTCYGLVDGVLCQCKAGYEGFDCGTAVNKCVTNPCLNGGSCSDDGICQCGTGYTGTRCETVVNLCDSHPCANGGSCLAFLDQYQCVCVADVYGVNCLNDTRPCGQPQCQHGGSCTNDGDDFDCKCLAGFSGKNCEIDDDDCASSPCSNGGSCTDLVDDFRCACVAGYTDKTCFTDIYECASSPCKNGTCIDGVNGFTCVCEHLFSGVLCETGPLHECDFEPCGNGASCLDISNQADRKTEYYCLCVDGWKGDNCTEEVDECKEFGAACLHNATCKDEFNSFSCDCAQGYEGTRCGNLKDFCSPANNKCENEAKCKYQYRNYFCDCPIGWTGKNCDQNINDCASSPCVNGTCNDLVHNFSCTCDPGFTGRTCSTDIPDCKSNTCLNKGDCTDKVNDYECKCAAGYEGKSCANNTDDCLSKPCQNGGNCTDGINDYTCTCAKGYDGKSCDHNIDDCLNKPCQHGGTCFDLVDDYSCTCVKGYDGKSCDHNIDDCKPDPCQNGGTCVDGVDSVTCQCPRLFNGTKCENELHQCDLTPCKNKGRCLGLVNGYICQCTADWCGLDCDIARFQARGSNANSLGCGPAPVFSGCQAAYDAGARKEGIFNINPDRGQIITAFCKFESGKGWLVFQRRSDSIATFKSVSQYENGFGDKTEHFWLGTESLHRLTAGFPKMKASLTRKNDSALLQANYASFSVGDKGSYYTLQVSGISGDAGNDLANGLPFKTAAYPFLPSRPGSADCAQGKPAAWWYNRYCSTNPNGDPFTWNTIMLKESIMMIHV